MTRRPAKRVPINSSAKKFDFCDSFDVRWYMTTKRAKKSALSFLVIAVVFCVVVASVYLGAQHYICNRQHTHVPNEICVVCSTVNQSKKLLAGAAASASGFCAALFGFVLVLGLLGFCIAAVATPINLKTRLNN